MDEETGLYYFSQRYLNPKDVGFISSDELREKYPNIGSYVYCLGNPVKYVDPDGMNVYTVGKQGAVTCVKPTKDNFDMLYTTDDYNRGKKNGQKIYNQSILSSLVKGNNKTSNNWSYRFADVESNADNKKDIFNIYKLCADFTHGEWEMFKYKKDHKTRYWVGSFSGEFSNDMNQNSTFSPNFKSVGLKNVIWGIHSHGLNVEQTTLKEIWKGMGYSGEGNEIPNSDSHMVHHKQFPYSYYIYSAPKRQIYLITPLHVDPIFIKSVGTPSDFNLLK